MWLWIEMNVTAYLNAFIVAAFYLYCYVKELTCNMYTGFFFHIEYIAQKLQEIKHSQFRSHCQKI